VLINFHSFRVKKPDSHHPGHRDSLVPPEKSPQHPEQNQEILADLQDIYTTAIYRPITRLRNDVMERQPFILRSVVISTKPNPLSPVLGRESLYNL
jgi:hypothetical protein